MSSAQITRMMKKMNVTTEVNLDEDEMYRFLSGSSRSCPYFQMDDEYKVVRKQI